MRGFLSFRYPKRLPREFGGGTLLVTPRADMRVLKRGWKASAHDLMLVARNLVAPGMTVWDLGANMGIFSALAAYRAGPQGHVCAVDADPTYAALVERNAKRLPQRYAPISVVCTAISDRVGVAEFATSKKGHARNRLVALDDHKDILSTRSVPTVKADDLLADWPRPDMIKVDVEGAEIAFLRGASQILSEVRPLFYIEVNPGKNAEIASEIFHSYNYALFHLQGDGSEKPVDLATFYTIARPL